MTPKQSLDNGKVGENVASISRQKNGRRIIQFAGPDKRRRSIRLGKVSQRTAELVKTKVENLVSAVIAGHAPGALQNAVHNRCKMRCCSPPYLLARRSKKRRNLLRKAALRLLVRLLAILYKTPQYPLGESNPSQLSDCLPSTYGESTMPGGAKSGAIADEIGRFSHSVAAGTKASLLEVIHLLSELAPDERAALIDFLKTWG